MEDPSQQPSPPPPLPARGSVVQFQKACHACGYSLFGLRTDSNCPECGVPVMDSLRGPLLCFASRAYLELLRKGLGWILVGLVLSVAKYGVSALFGVLASAGFLGSWATHLDELVAVASSGVLLYGWWQFTMPDPAFEGTEKTNAARRVLRIALIAQCAALLGSLASEFGMGIVAELNIVLPGAGTILKVIVFLLKFGGFVATIVQLFAGLIYCTWLWQRVPDLKRAQLCRTYMWVLPILFTVGWIVLVGPLVGLVLYTLMLFALREAVTRARELAASGVPGALAEEVPKAAPEAAQETSR